MAHYCCAVQIHCESGEAVQVPDTGEDDPLVAPCWGLVSDSPLSRRSVTSAPGAAMAYLVAMRDDRYRPADIDEMEQKVSLINEPIREVIELRPGQSAVSLHALLVGVRNQAQALLDRLETRGVVVWRDDQRATVRELYVQTKRQVKALAATLELDGLE